MKGEMRDIFIPDTRERQAPPPLVKPPRRRSGVARFILWAFLACVLFILFFAVIPGVFSGAKVFVTPRSTTVVVDNDLEATKGEGGDGVRFEVMKLDDVASVPVAAVGSEMVSEKAQGNIVIYNEYSNASQRLVANTRFRSMTGKVYRIEKDVTVPGTSVIKGVVTPGSVEVTVVADAPGEEYNAGLSDFTIPGFEGTPRYEKFYARSKTELTGGYVGVRRTASETDLANARTNIESQLRAHVMKMAVSQTPADFMLYTDPSLITVTTESNNATNTDSLLITGTATLRGILVSTSEMARVVASKLVPSYKGENVTITNIEQLALTIAVPASQDIESLTGFPFHLKGSATIEWVFDEEALKLKLVGQKKSEYSSVFSEFPGIERASVEFSPVWASSFPHDVTRITVVKVRSTQ